LPTYAYRCESCGTEYEKREGFSAPARQKCPRCGNAANRVLFAPPIVFKGSGFYSTDSRSSGGGGDGFSPADPTNGHGHSHDAGGHTHDAASEGAESAAAS